MSKPTDAEKAEAVAQELRELLREARGMLGDIRTEMRNARGLYDALAREQLHTAVSEGNERLREHYNEAIRAGSDSIKAQFDRIERIMVANGIIPRATADDEMIVMVGGTGALGPEERAKHVRQIRPRETRGKRQ